MTIAQRIRPAVAASLKHFSASCAVALACAALVFGIWYPYPYSELVGGRELFILVVSVDVACGPLLTLVVFDPSKSRTQLWRDMGMVVLMQLTALGYGLYSVLEARPVLLAFEGDRFRVVRVPDVDRSGIHSAPQDLRPMSLRGPRLVGVRLAKSTDPDFVQSIQRSMQGDPPSFRPDRWVGFETQRANVIADAKPLSQLRRKHSSRQQPIDEAVERSGMSEERLGYLPLVAGSRDDWVVVVSLDDGKPRAYLPLDGFE